MSVRAGRRKASARLAACRFRPYIVATFPLMSLLPEGASFEELVQDYFLAVRGAGLMLSALDAELLSELGRRGGALRGGGARHRAQRRRRRCSTRARESRCCARCARAGGRWRRRSSKLPAQRGRRARRGGAAAGEAPEAERRRELGGDAARAPARVAATQLAGEAPALTARRRLLERVLAARARGARGGGRAGGARLHAAAARPALPRAPRAVARGRGAGARARHVRALAAGVAALPAAGAWCGGSAGRSQERREGCARLHACSAGRMPAGRLCYGMRRHGAKRTRRGVRRCARAGRTVLERQGDRALGARLRVLASAARCAAAAGTCSRQREETFSQKVGPRQLRGAGALRVHAAASSGWPASTRWGCPGCWPTRPSTTTAAAKHAAGPGAAAWRMDFAPPLPARAADQQGLHPQRPGGHREDAPAGGHARAPGARAGRARRATWRSRCSTPTIRRGFQEGKSGGEIIGPLSEVEVLAIDELGKGRGSPFELETLDELIARRYNAGRTTLFATNYSLEPERQGRARGATGYQLHGGRASGRARGRSCCASAWASASTAGSARCAPSWSCRGTRRTSAARGRSWSPRLKALSALTQR